MAASQRPTIAPPFDPETFARESESKLRAALAKPSSETVRRAPPTLAEGPPSSQRALGRVALAARVPEVETRTRAKVPESGSRVAPSPHAVPVLAIAFSELTTRTLDHRAGFLLSLVDGSSSIETILDLSGMPTDEAAELLARLVAQGILALR